MCKLNVFLPFDSFILNKSTLRCQTGYYDSASDTCGIFASFYT